MTDKKLPSDFEKIFDKFYTHSHGTYVKRIAKKANGNWALAEDIVQPVSRQERAAGPHLVRGVVDPALDGRAHGGTSDEALADMGRA